MAKTLQVRTKVTKIDEKNKLINEKYKTSFWCESTSGKDRLCIYWQRSTIEVGDEVILIGYIIDPANVFMVNQMITIKQEVKNGS